MNEIIQENAILEGRTDRSYWDGSHSTEIEGFATDMSVNAGTRVDFKINVNSGAGSDYVVEIFRLGYYGGSGAREVAQWTNTNAKVQPNALVDASRGLVDAGNWSVTDGWNVPTAAVSGVYLARLRRLDSNGNPIDGAVNQIPFVVRNDGESVGGRQAALAHVLLLFEQEGVVPIVAVFDSGQVGFQVPVVGQGAEPEPIAHEAPHLGALVGVLGGGICAVHAV
jgi:hypothetical protein